MSRCHAWRHAPPKQPGVAPGLLALSPAFGQMKVICLRHTQPRVSARTNARTRVAHAPWSGRTTAQSQPLDRTSRTSSTRSAETTARRAAVSDETVPLLSNHSPRTLSTRCAHTPPVPPNGRRKLTGTASQPSLSTSHAARANRRG